MGRRLISFVLALMLVLNNVSAQTVAYMPDLGLGSPRLDIYTFAQAHNAPVMVYVHGGAWVAGHRANVQRKPAYFRQRGMVFVSVGYRLVPTTTVEGQLSDIDSALAWVSQNIAQFGGDPGNIHLMGHSAGAHLVSMTAVAPLPLAAGMIARGDIRSVISNDIRAYDIPRMAAIRPGGRLHWLYRRPFGNAPERWRSLSPIYLVDPARNTPDFLIMYSNMGDDASRRSFAEDFGRVLARNGVSVALFDGQHYNHSEIKAGIGRYADLTNAVWAFLEPRI